MKLETFYRKFANLPIDKRELRYQYFINGHASTISPLGVYELLNEAIEKKYEADKEVKRLLEIGEKILH